MSQSISPLARSGSPDLDHTGDIFDFAPVSLWLEDYSGLRLLFERWRAEGVTDLGAHLRSDLSRVSRCFDGIRVVKVNHRTLELFEARDTAHLVDHASDIFRADVLAPHLDELGALWEGRLAFSGRTVNYTLGGRRLDVLIRGRVLPGHERNWDRVLLAIEDVTEREEALRQQAASEAYARGLFHHSPVSLWVADFSGVRTLIDNVRARGIVDLRAYLDAHPQFVEQTLGVIKLLDVNQQTLDLFKAADKATFLSRFNDVIGPRNRASFADRLVDLWAGHLVQQSEVVYFALDGTEVHLQNQFSILPGHEASWSFAQVAMTDITARKKTEKYLAFLGSHDVLTKLHNRAFYDEQSLRLERQTASPLTILFADLNGLKEVNDTKGHAAGDALLVRAGEVLAQAVDAPCSVSRIGGDEFAMLLPGVGAPDGDALMATIDNLVAVNNRCYGDAPLSFAMGRATRHEGERLVDTARRADQAMYDAKRRHYARHGDRRRSS